MKLVVFDLDGTLIGREEKLDSTGYEIAELLHSENIPFTIATGRTEELARQFADELGVKVPYIVSNGAKIMTNEQVLSHQEIPIRGLQEIITLADGMGLSVIYTIEGKEHVLRETPWVLAQRAKFDRYHSIRPLSQEDWQCLFIDKVTLMDPVRDGRIVEVEERAKQLDREYGYTRYTDKAIEIVNSLANKGAAVSWLVDHLGIDLAGVVAFGDHQNDMEMIKAAGIGVAVHNAIPEVKEIADMVTSEPEARGVLTTLKELLGSRVG